MISRLPHRLLLRNIFEINAEFLIIIMAIIAFFCTIGIGKATWLGFAGYMGVGLILWLYMILIKWKHEKVWMKTPDGDKEY